MSFCLGDFDILLWVVWCCSCKIATIVHVGAVPHSQHVDKCVCVTEGLLTKLLPSTRTRVSCDKEVSTRTLLPIVLEPPCRC
jgi:hypothetical protein